MKKYRLLKDKLISKSFLTLTLLSIGIVILVGVGLYYKSIPILEKNSLSKLLFSSEWKPFKEAFGFYPYIIGTLWITAISIVLALPLSLLTAIYLSEYAPLRIRKLVLPLIELLSDIPPIIFGVWGVLVIIPLIQDTIAPHFVEKN